MSDFISEKENRRIEHGNEKENDREGVKRKSRNVNIVTYSQSKGQDSKGETNNWKRLSKERRREIFLSAGLFPGRREEKK